MNEALNPQQIESYRDNGYLFPLAIKPPTMARRFTHIFSGGYAAGYYSYMWSEVMDADAYRAFKEAGDIFDFDTARKLAAFIYSAGGRQDPGEAYVAFRGRMPKIDALLEDRGLSDAA